MAIFLLLLCATLQATHLHGLNLSGSHRAGLELIAGGNAADTELTCPICQVGGFTVPAGDAGNLLVLLVAAGVVVSLSSRTVPVSLHFAQWTRPPPSLI